MEGQEESGAQESRRDPAGSQWLLFARSNSVDRSDEPDWPCSNTSRSKPSSSSLTFLPTPLPILLLFFVILLLKKEICDDFWPTFLRGFEFFFFESTDVRDFFFFFWKDLRNLRVRFVALNEILRGCRVVVSSMREEVRLEDSNRIELAISILRV